MFRFPRRLSGTLNFYAKAITLPPISSTSPSNLPSLPSWQVQRWKHPTRGGQNLSMRYRRLEKSLRGKEAYGQQISDLTERMGSAISDSGTPVIRSAQDKVKTFMGFVIPEEPKPPEADECCMSGCAICVYDLYQEALTDYEKSVASLRTSLNLLHIPEDQWPPNIRTSQKNPVERKKDVGLRAFEELERRLQEKKEKQLSSPEKKTLRSCDARTSC